MRVILCFLLVLVAAPAGADWVNVFYSDPMTIGKDGRSRRVKELVTRQQGIKDAVMSIRAFVEYDCNEDRRGILSSTTFTEAMGGGNVIETIDTPGEWKPLAPGSAAKTLLSFACAE